MRRNEPLHPLNAGRRRWCVALATSGLLFGAVAALVAGNEGAPYQDPHRFAQEVHQFQEQDAASPPPEGAIVFVGSSSIRLWHDTLARDMAPLTVIPRGFGGSTMEDVRYYLDTLVLRHRPRAVVLYEGDNDVADGVAPARILATFHAIVERLHRALPKTRMYVLSVKPSPSRWTLWPQMQETNRLLRQACDQDEQLTFVDVAAPLLDPQGAPRDELFRGDRLHLNAQGYAAWTHVVRPLLLERERGQPEGQ